MSNSSPAFSPSAACSHLPSSPGCDNKKHVQTLSVVPCSCSFTKSCPTPGNPMDCTQHTRLPYLLEFAQTHVHWMSEAIQPSSVVPFSSCLQSFPASGSFQMSQLFTSSGQSTGASTSVLPKNTQDWSPLGWTGWISLQSKGLSRVFSKTTIQKHQFFGLSFHIHTWPLEKP